MSAMAYQITNVSIVYSTVCSGADQWNIFRVTGLCAGNSPVTGELPAQKASYAEMFSFDDVIIIFHYISANHHNYTWQYKPVEKYKSGTHNLLGATIRYRMLPKSSGFQTINSSVHFC